MSLFTSHVNAQPSLRSAFVPINFKSKVFGLATLSIHICHHLIQIKKCPCRNTPHILSLPNSQNLLASPCSVYIFQKLQQLSISISNQSISSYHLPRLLLIVGLSFWREIVVTLVLAGISLLVHWLTRFDNVVNDVFVIVSNIIQVQIVYSNSQTATLKIRYRKNSRANFFFCQFFSLQNKHPIKIETHSLLTLASNINNVYYEEKIVLYSLSQQYVLLQHTLGVTPSHGQAVRLGKAPAQTKATLQASPASALDTVLNQTQQGHERHKRHK